MAATVRAHPAQSQQVLDRRDALGTSYVPAVQKREGAAVAALDGAWEQLAE